MSRIVPSQLSVGRSRSAAALPRPLGRFLLVGVRRSPLWLVPGPHGRRRSGPPQNAKRRLLRRLQGRSLLEMCRPGRARARSVSGGSRSSALRRVEGMGSRVVVPARLGPSPAESCAHVRHRSVCIVVPMRLVPTRVLRERLPSGARAEPERCPRGVTPCPTQKRASNTLRWSIGVAERGLCNFWG